GHMRTSSAWNSPQNVQGPNSWPFPGIEATLARSAARTDEGRPKFVQTWDRFASSSMVRPRLVLRPDPLLLLCAALLGANGCARSTAPQDDDAPAHRTKVLTTQQPVKVAKNAPSNPPKPTPTPPKTGPADSTPTVPPLSAGARTEDENNTIDVFRAAAPATVFVSQSQVVIDRWQRRAEV